MKKTVVKIKFPEDVKTRFCNYVRTKKVSVKFYDALEIKHHNTNLIGLVPFKISVSNDECEMIILYYGSYMYDTQLFFLYDITKPISFNKIKEIVKKYMW